MRLIDADKLVELFTPYVSEDKKVVYQPRQIKMDDIKNAPTVKAIPIEWIKRYIAEEGIYPNRELLSVEQADAIERMVENWEKDNETN